MTSTRRTRRPLIVGPIDPSKVELGVEVETVRPTDPRVQVGGPSRRR
jgi:hypothetical protein